MIKSKQKTAQPSIEDPSEKKQNYRRNGVGRKSAKTKSPMQRCSVCRVCSRFLPVEAEGTPLVSQTQASDYGA